MRSFAGKMNPNYKHGMKGTRFYDIWRMMKQRCYNPKKISYKYYGEKGISVCKRWHTFLNFKKDMYQKYLAHCEQCGEKQTTLERKDNDTSYSPENCCWATPKQQANNRSKPL